MRVKSLIQWELVQCGKTWVNVLDVGGIPDGPIVTRNALAGKKRATKHDQVLVNEFNAI